MKRVSFDFDHTLSSLKIQHFAHSLIKQGIEVWICTARHSNENKLVDNWGNEDLFFVTDFLKIPQEQIECSGKEFSCTHFFNDNC